MMMMMMMMMSFSTSKPVSRYADPLFTRLDVYLLHWQVDTGGEEKQRSEGVLDLGELTALTHHLSSLDILPEIWQ